MRWCFISSHQKKADLAIANYDKALEIVEKQLGPTHFKASVILNNKALVYEEKGDLEKALAINLEALKIIELRQA